MKELEIKNWDTASAIVKWDYINGLVIGEVKDHKYASGRGSQYIYRFYKEGKEILAIAITRKPSSDKYAIRGKHYVTGKYSDVHRLSKDGIAHAPHVRYVFNQIINSLC